MYNLNAIIYLRNILSYSLHLIVMLCFIHVDLIADTSISVWNQNRNASTTAYII